MNILLDTHELIWALNDDPQLSKQAQDYILDPDNDIYYSTVSIWEVAIKHAIHPDNITFTGDELAKYCAEAGFFNLPVYDKHVFAMETLKRPDDAPKHNDPFDRLLIGQAKAENMTFLTHDSLIPYYNEKCVISV